MLLLILFAFLAGVVTILSPCILPILPIVLTSSLAGGRRRPVGVVTGFVLSFTFFTLALTAIVKATGIPSDSLRIIAVVTIFLLGLSLILPQTQVLLERVLGRLAGMVPTGRNQGGFLGGLLVGLSLGLIWSPCVGPILAAIITLAVSSQLTVGTVLITFAYSLGSALPMFAITYGGRQLLQKIPGLLQNTGKVQQLFGAIMMLTAVALYFSVDRQFQAYVLKVFPAYGAGLTKLEENSLVKQQLEKLRSGNASLPDLNLNQPAPDFVGGGNWINSTPLSLKKELKGKVVLVDFWTYSCINCIRTFPYLKKWYDTYKNDDFVIIGVHSPEFEFEKKTDNVTKAVKDFGLLYPVVQDNEFAIWKAYHNQYWPAHYLIDKTGNIRYQHFGEGNYLETENAIRSLLNQSMLESESGKKESGLDQNNRLTPETYLGWKRAEAYVLDNTLRPNQISDYSFEGKVANDAVALKGKWQVEPEYIQSAAENSSLTLNFVGHQVYLVMNKISILQNAKVQVLLDGKPVPAEFRTADLDDQSQVHVTQPRKYDLINLGQNYGRHELQLIFPAGVQAFAFTFG
jgi:cytochrome c biogenesis protein CcdA/thiol-disulfide isomerase/thioredoxin